MPRAARVPYACAVLNAGAAIALASLAPGTVAQPDVQTRVDFVDQHLLAWRTGWAVWIAASSSLMLFFIWWRQRICGGFAPADPRPSGHRDSARTDPRPSGRWDSARTDPRQSGRRHSARTDPRQSGRWDSASADAGRDRGDPVMGGARHRFPRAASPLAIAGVGLVFDLIGESLQIVAVPGAPALMPLAVLLTAGVANGLYTVTGALLTLGTGLSGPRAAWTWAVWAAGAGVSLAAFAGSVGGLVAASALLFVLFCPWCLALERWLRP